MPYFVLIFLFVLIGILVFLKIQYNEEKKEIERFKRPYRIVKNGIGEYLLQEYSLCSSVYNSSTDKVCNTYVWHTIYKTTDLTDAKIQFKIKLNELKCALEAKEQFDTVLETQRKQKELEETIVEEIDTRDI